MKEIPLTKGQVAIVDDADFDWLSMWRWFASKRKHNYYAHRAKRTQHGQAMLAMHQVIMGIGPGSFMRVDHIDGHGLNNQRSNLRLATHQQNIWNTRRRRRPVSGFIGVSWKQDCRLWQARIQVDGRNTKKHLGFFQTAEEAAMRYDEEARRLRGEFAVTNNQNGFIFAV